MRLNKSVLTVIIILVALATIIVMSGLNFLIPKDNAGVNQKGNKYLTPSKMEKIFLAAKDNIRIAADVYPVKNPIGWLVLVHMMPSSKESWIDLAEEFQKIGYESVAIDLRGHGQSEGGPKGFLNFSDEEHQKSIFDLEAAVDYLLKERQAIKDKIIFIGASIGANLSLQYLVEYPEFKTAVLLSAGLNYRGIKTEPLAKKLKSDQKVFFVSAKDDGNNAEENLKLYNIASIIKERKIQIYETGGHGTDILKNQPELKNLIIDFIK